MAANNSLAPLSPDAPPVGQGLAKMAGNTIALQKQYTAYASAMMEQGKQPMTFPEWAKAINAGTVVTTN